MGDCLNQTLLGHSDHGASNSSLIGIINLVVLPAVCAFGIVGNLLNLAILTRRKLKKSIRTLEQAANLCLIYLATSDLLFCVFAFSTTFLPADNIYDKHGLLLEYAIYSVGIINVFIMESTMLTVAMSLERYLAICFPLRQDIYLTTNRIKFVIPVTFLFSVSFNIPVFLRYEVVTLCVNSSHEITTNGAFTNLTSLVSSIQKNVQVFHEKNVFIIIPNITQVLQDITANVSLSPSSNIQLETSPSLTSSTSSSSTTNNSIFQTLSVPPHSSPMLPSWPATSLPGNITRSVGVNTIYTTKIVPLGGSQVYDTTYRTVWAFVGNFIPLFLLLYFNFCLCRKIYRSYKQRKQLGRQVRPRSSSHILTMTLVAIVVLFLLLVAPSEVTLQISHLTSSHDTPLYRNIEAVLNLMQSINFSGNFILYCIISPYFRKTLKYMMLCGCYNVYHVSRHSKQEFHTSLL